MQKAGEQLSRARAMNLVARASLFWILAEHLRRVVA